MPGIYGGTAQVLSKMSEELLISDNFEIKDEFKDSSCEIGQIGLKKNLFRAYKSDDIFVFVDGYVFNIEEINKKFNCSEEFFSSLLAKAYKENFLNELLKLSNGYFVAVLYDQINKKILLFSDRLGTRFLYYYYKNKRFLFGSEIRCFLTLDFVDKEIDKTSLECFVNGGNNFYLLGNNTYFKNIKLLKPATILEYDIKQNKIDQKYYWTFQDIKPSNITYEDAIDKLHNLVESAVLKRIKNLDKDDYLLPLSGGLDSRLLFAILNNHKKMPSFIYTNGEQNCTDVLYAKALCKNYNYKHYINHPKNLKNYLEVAKKSSLLTEGMTVFFEYGTYDFFEGKFLLSGYVGDMVFGESFKSDSKMLNKKMDSQIAEFFYGKFKDLSDYNDDYFNINKIEASLFINRVRRYTAQMLNIELNFNEQILPYIDNDIIDFIYSIPDDYRASNYLYSDMLLKFYPDYFKKIPWNRYNRPIQGKIYKNNRFNINWLMGKIERCSFLSRKWKKSILKRINYHEWFAKKTFHVFQKELIKKENLKEIEEMYNHSVIKELFSKESWKEIGENITNKNAWKIALFVTAELYFRKLKEKKVI